MLLWKVVLPCSLFVFLLILVPPVRSGTPANAMSTNAVSIAVGSVLDANRAQVGGDLAFAGTTIYDGDRLETDQVGALRSRLHESQVYLGSSTLISVRRLSAGFSLTLVHGAVVVSSPEGETFELFSDGATIDPVGTEATIIRVTRVSPSELLLTSERGAIQVSFGDYERKLEGGSNYRMIIRSDDSSPQDNGDHGKPRPASGGRNRIVLILVPAAAVAVGVVLWRALMSPSAP
jgi:hypothetical protein